MMVTTIEDLAAELLINVFRHITDLESLDNFLRASPRAFHVFSENGVPILDSLLDSSCIHRHCAEAIRTVACIRMGEFPRTINSISALQLRVTSVALLEECDRTTDCFFPKVLPCMPRQGALSLLATARRISYLTLEVLRVHLERFRALRPQKLPSALNEHMKRHPLPMSPFIERATSEMIPVDIKDIGQPTWAEEHQVYLAFWRMQLVEDLRRAVNQKIVLGWGPIETYKLNDFSLSVLYDLEELPYILAYENYGGSISLSEEYHETMDGSVMLTIQDWLKHQPELPSLYDPMRRRPWPMPPPPDNSHDNGNFDREKLNPTIEILNGLFEDLSADFSHHRECLWSAAFRPLGFALWSLDRLEGFGLRSGGFTEPSNLLSFISILGSNEKQMLCDGTRETAWVDREVPQRTRTTISGISIGHVNPIVERFWEDQGGPTHRRVFGEGEPHRSDFEIHSLIDAGLKDLVIQEYPPRLP